ncbi:triose-phosphate isomerase [Legionella impletisoli]|uniref:Triosephosphate isomerase n=1 Tax=Legionella impletisoli TaxID=343510 RepID=A0A917NAR9_9GAMM|nr:triose-phosphate isomerase [Legionella impletisoli]GGI84262.1 triosephosphate isomerase [Legionella impletisoli]
MRQKMVMGNWKMNGDRKRITELLQGILTIIPASLQECCAVFPPSIYLPVTSEHLANSLVKYGAQNVYPADNGAYTGELSGPMLKDYHCRYVLVGHSERRHLFNEDEKFVAEKFHHVKEHGMIPVLCVGETLKERETGMTEEVLARQLHAVAEQSNGSFRQCIVAYEPVWAIGTGQTATPEQAQNAHAFIRAEVARFDADVAEELTILYGGSVNDNNARSLFEMPDVDGGLVGGASLNAQQFVEIVKCIN